jgi:membrane-associated phospholipid phosphatase
VALHTTAGAGRDLRLFQSASGFAVLHVRLAGERALRTIDVSSILIALVLLFALAALRGRFAHAVAAVAVVVASVASAELVKHGLPHVAHGLPDGRPPTWPSGHTSIAASLGLALVLAAPPVLRPVLALVGAAYSAGIGLSVVVLGWHYPSDVVGSFFICGFWAFAAAAVVPVGAPGRRLELQGLVLAILAVAIALFVAAAIAGAHPDAVAATRSSRSVVAVAAVLGLLSVALFGAFTAALAERRS